MGDLKRDDAAQSQSYIDDAAQPVLQRDDAAHSQSYREMTPHRVSHT